MLQYTVVNAIKKQKTVSGTAAIATHIVGGVLLGGILATQWWLGKRDAEQLKAAQQQQKQDDLNP